MLTRAMCIPTMVTGKFMMDEDESSVGLSGDS